jgi:hypothetical protein
MLMSLEVWNGDVVTRVVTRILGAKNVLSVTG